MKIIRRDIAHLAHQLTSRKSHVVVAIHHFMVALSCGSSTLRSALMVMLLVQATSALRLKEMNVPGAALVGQDVVLSCNIDLEGDLLYSFKWYKDNVEFYRYMPKDYPNKHFFPIPGVKVDAEKSTDNSVYLKSIDFSTAGTYKCEASADFPSFSSVEAEKRMGVGVFVSSTGSTDSNRSLLLQFLLMASVLWIL